MTGLPSRSVSLPALLAALVLTACGPKVLHVDAGARQPRSPEQVQLFLDSPDRPYRTIALIRSEQVGVFKGVEDRKQQVRAEAARLGADAVILGLMSDAANTSVVTTNTEGEVSVGFGSSDELRVFGRAIVFTTANEEPSGRD